MSTITNHKAPVKFPEFHENKISTTTQICCTNLNFDIAELFEKLPVTPFTVVQRRRGRKIPNSEMPDPNINVASGSIITLKKDDHLRGVDLNMRRNKRKSSLNKRGQFFRNCLTIVMIIEGKKINLKASRGGKLQVTGCKNNHFLYEALAFFWKYIKENCKYTFSRGSSLDITIIPAMTNIDFNLGFNLDRDLLSDLINTHTEHLSMSESSFGYTGLSVKLKIEGDINLLEIMRLCEVPSSPAVASGGDGKVVWSKEKILYRDYLATISEKERNKVLNKKRYTTMLCFSSGVCLCSSISRQTMEKSYKDFIGVIREWYTEIRERVDSRPFLKA
jgi:TATA-box binding protein (TBP) (component of TFIID and TFIIIB)